jgi:DNA repair protein REV1
VDVLEKYLTKVIAEERDMDKARTLVAWLRWIVEEEGREGIGKEGWMEALDAVKAAVQEAMKSRGLGPMDLG